MNIKPLADSAYPRAPAEEKQLVVSLFLDTAKENL